MFPEKIAYRSGLRDRHEELLPDFQRLLVIAARPTSWCLDIGCGEGRVTFELVPMVRWVVGIDHLADRIAEARNKAQLKGINNASFLVADAENTDYTDLAPTARFQLIASNLCVTNKIISHSSEALAEDGRFIVTCFETRHWEETGQVSDYAYDENHLRAVLLTSKLEPEEMKTVLTVIEFESIDQLREEYLPQQLVKRWENDGRWPNLEHNFESGKRTLTSSKIVFSAHPK